MSLACVPACVLEFELALEFVWALLFELELEFELACEAPFELEGALPSWPFPSPPWPPLPPISWSCECVETS